MRKISFVFSLLFFLSSYGYAQFFSGKPLKISVLDQSISLPNTWFLDYSFNPTVMVGTEIDLKSGSRNSIFISGDLGFYYHKNIQSALFLNVGIGYRQDFWKMYASLRLGAGYSHIFAGSPVYKFKDGDYEEITDFGRPTFSPFGAFELGYTIGKNNDSPEVFITMIESIDINTLTFPHQFVGVGLRIYPFK